MINLKSKWVALATASVLSAALLNGCGGDSNTLSSNNGSNGGTQSIDSAAVVDFIQQLMASYDENSEPVDINSLTLASDETVDFTPII